MYSQIIYNYFKFGSFSSSLQHSVYRVHKKTGSVDAYHANTMITDKNIALNNNNNDNNNNNNNNNSNNNSNNNNNNGHVDKNKIGTHK